MGNTLKTGLLLAVLTVLFVAVGNAVGGQSGMLTAFAFAVLMNVGAYWFSDKIVLRMYRAQEVSEAEAPQLQPPFRCRKSISSPRIPPTRSPREETRRTPRLP